MRRGVKKRAFMLGLLATATLGLGGACGSSGNGSPTQVSPSQPSASRPETTTRLEAPQEFVSKRYNFRVTLTKDWSESDGQVNWNGKKLEGVDSPAFANFTDASAGRTLVAAAAPVGKGAQLAGWRAAMVRAASPFCSESSSVRKTTLGGEPALAWVAKCSDGYDVNKLAALHGQRGYMIFLPSDATNDNAVDRRIFESIRRSFLFTR